MRRHAVVDAAAGQYHFRVIADELCLVRQVVWIDPNAVPANQARASMKLKFCHWLALTAFLTSARLPRFPRKKIVQPNHSLIQLEQGFE